MAKTLAQDDAVDDVMAMILRSKTPAERLEIAFGMWRYARDTILRIVQAEHPEWLPAECSAKPRGGCCMECRNRPPKIFDI